MSKKSLSILLIVGGILIVLVMLFSGYLGLSTNLVIGWRKLLGVGFGLIIAVAGIVLATRKEVKPAERKKTKK